MNALRKSDHYYFELSEYIYDKDGNEYNWDEVILCPLEGEDVNYRLLQEKKEELREKYAGMAMQAFITNGFSENSLPKDPDEARHYLAMSCIKMADVLIEELSKEK